MSLQPNPGTKFVDDFFISWEPYLFYALSPLSLVATCFQKKNMGTGNRDANSTVLANSTLIYSVDEPQLNTLLTQSHNGDLHPVPNSLQSLWQRFKQRGILLSISDNFSM